MKIMVTGGAGFIGSNYIHYIFNKYTNIEIVNYDKLTYAGNLDNLRDIENNPRYKFIKGDICDASLVETIVKKERVDQIINFAAESHVDRSISNPDIFIRTDILGTFNLLETCRKFDVERYIQISTDEVYGSIEQSSFTETDPLKPSSPYSASKASADLLVNSYYITYGLPVCVTRSSNNFGPYQYPEKLIPFFIIKALNDENLPVYGDGLQVRDWLYVEDNCDAIDLVRYKGEKGRIYNIGGENERTNLEITEMILTELGKSSSLIKNVKDRPGHDRRYSVNSEKMKKLGWKAKKSKDFKNCMKKTICWYVDNKWWWEKIVYGEKYAV